MVTNGSVMLQSLFTVLQVSIFVGFATHMNFSHSYPRVLISKLNGRKIIGSIAMRLTSKLMCARQTSDRVTLEPVLSVLCFAIYRHSNKAGLEGFFFFFFFVLLNLESSPAEWSGSQRANKGIFSFQGLSNSIRMNPAICHCKGMRFSSQASSWQAMGSHSQPHNVGKKKKNIL